MNSTYHAVGPLSRDRQFWEADGRSSYTDTVYLPVTGSKVVFVSTVMNLRVPYEAGNFLTNYKICSHHMTCVTNADPMNGGWRLEFKLCLKPRTIPSIPRRTKTLWLKKLITSLKIRKACGIDDIPNECLRNLPRRPLVHLTHLFNHCFRLSHVPSTLKEVNVTALPNPGKDPKFPQNLRPISLLSTKAKLSEKAIQKIIQRHFEDNNLLNASQFGFRTRHRTILKCMRLKEHVTLNFNNVSTAAVFLDTERAFDTTWHPGLLYKWSKLHFSANLIKLISSYLSHRKFSVSVESELSTPKEIQAGVPQGSVLAFTLYSLYINDTLQNPGVQLAVCVDDTCIYATDPKDDYDIRKLQCGLTSMEAWCEHWNMKIN
jgi:hypothetical protein